MVMALKCKNCPSLFVVGQCSPGFISWSSNCYKLVVDEYVNWVTAFARCLSMGAQLLVVETRAEWQSLVPVFAQGKIYVSLLLVLGVKTDICTYTNI